uniref:Uncharacterized protein n=1 Tax=Rhizophora mucronata TaxID=61149 RepID=A0A2P2LC52_RHIMU
MWPCSNTNWCISSKPSVFKYVKKRF